MTILNYFSVVLPNKPGEGIKLLGALKGAGVNLVALWAYPIKGRKSVADVAPADAAAFKKIARSLKLEVSPKKSAFFFNGADYPGAIADQIAKLAEAGINVHAVQAICAGEGRYGAMLQVAPEDEKKAKKVLGA